MVFFFSSRRRHTRSYGDWSSDVCSSDLILSFAKGVTSGYLPLGGIMVSKAIKQAMDSVKPENRWMHAYTYSAHPTCCAVAVKNLEIMTRERLWENAAKMGERLHARLTAAFRDHPHAGDIRGGKGLLAAVEL